MSGIAFQNVGGLKPNRTRFDWNFSKKFDTDFGWIVPCWTQFCLPGDFYNIDLSILARCLPMLAPVIHRAQVKVDFFFVRKRIIDDCNSRPGCGNDVGDPILLKTAQQTPPLQRFNWELFSTGGFDGLDAQTHPVWTPSPANKDPSSDWGDRFNSNPNGWGKYTLWDYLGYPTTNEDSAWTSPVVPNDDLRRCYNLIFNEYYRDETVWSCSWTGNFAYSPLPTNTYTVLPWSNERIQRGAWLKDYFTSSLPFQQRGISPALPLSGNLALDFTPSQLLEFETSGLSVGVSSGFGVTPLFGTVSKAPDSGAPQSAIVSGNRANDIIRALNKGTVDIGNGLTYDIADFRLTFQIQKWLERNARAGVRYNEFIYAHWGRHTGDNSLQRPEYIGGLRCPIIFSEVLQTSQSAETPQGTMAGHGITVNGSHIGTYECSDYGYIMGLLRVMPDPAYTSQGFKRTSLYKNKYDFPQAEFVNLSEQDISQAEIFINGDQSDNNLFGYQGMYDELRTQEDNVSGSMRDTLNYWHLNRNFETPPMLNRQFIECNFGNEMRRIFAEQTLPGIIIDCEFAVKAVRPIPAIAEPGLIDHH